jgi:hypothetical protein
MSASMDWTALLRRQLAAIEADDIPTFMELAVGPLPAAPADTASLRECEELASAIASRLRLQRNAIRAELRRVPRPDAGLYAPSALAAGALDIRF